MGHPRAHRLFSTNLPIIGREVRAVLPRVGPHLSATDLALAGVRGLAEAAQSYEPLHEGGFVRHATSVVRCALVDTIRAALAERGAGVPRPTRVREVATALAVQLGRSATVTEVVQVLPRPEPSSDLGLPARVRMLEAHDRILAARQQAADSCETLRGVQERACRIDPRTRYILEQTYRRDRPSVDLSDELELTPARVEELRLEGLRAFAGQDIHIPSESANVRTTPAARVVGLDKLANDVVTTQLSFIPTQFAGLGRARPAPR